MKAENATTDVLNRTWAITWPAGGVPAVASNEPGFRQTPARPKPLGLFFWHAVLPFTRPGDSCSSLPWFNICSPFSGEVKLGAPTMIVLAPADTVSAGLIVATLPA